ncbi:hypothetical protein IV203_010361 [Nitzschia inconspicua]|uniref:RanBP2-type domain-containing protein n=1 Tax=Nitzschia inconspicua TaxID=303405 RepID=A0A9K3KXF8_9STRA|nr:hypothetical protein IV203_010361 [Nitzschia inconspicua]
MIQNTILKSPPTTAVSSSSPNPPGDDVMSMAEFSEANDSQLSSWRCPHCSYQNVDPTKEKCALCGIKDMEHIKQYRLAMRRQRAPGDISSYRWGTSSEHSITSRTSSDHNNNNKGTLRNINNPSTGPPVQIIKAKMAVPSSSTTPTPEKKTEFTNYPLPLSAATSFGTPPKSPTTQTQRIPTPHDVSTKQSQEEKLSTFGNKQTDTVLGSTVSRSRPGRHGSFDYYDDGNNGPPLPPSKRPPRSPDSKGSSKLRPLSSTTEKKPFVSFNKKDMQSDRDAKQRGRRTRQSSITSSTVALKSGMEGDVFFEVSVTSSTNMGPPAEDNSVSRLSYSSKSTVKVSNTTTKMVDNLLRMPTKAGTTGVSLSQEEDIVSLVPPQRSKSSPPAGNSGPAAEEVVVDSPTLQKYRSGCSALTPVGVIHEDMEQSSTPCHTNPTQIRTPADGLNPFVPPSQFYFPDTTGKSAASAGGEITIISLENTKKLPSVSSLASSTASTRYRALLGAETDNSLHGSSGVVNYDFENQSDLVDEDGNPDKETNPRWKRSIPPLWLVVGGTIVGLVIVLMSVFLSSNSSSTKFQIGITEYPAVTPQTTYPSPTIQGEIGNVVNTNIPGSEEIGNPFDDIENDQPGEIPSLFEVSHVLTKSGTEGEGLGLAVAVGGGIRIAMLGHGFVRVVDWSSSFPGTLTWPLRPSDLSETSFGEGKTVGEGINVTAGAAHEIPSIAMSGDGEKIAIAIDTGLSVWQFRASEQQWELIFSDRILGSDVDSIPDDTVSTSVTISVDGRMVAAGMVALTKNGYALTVRLWDLEADSSDRSVALLVKILDEHDPSKSGPLLLNLSNFGEILAVCLNENIFVKAVGDIDSEKDSYIDLNTDIGPDSFPEDGSFNVASCGLSGDGLVFAVSHRHSDETIVYSFRNSVWGLDDVLQVSGSAISLDSTGKLIVIGGSTNDVTTLWGRDNNGDGYQLAYQIRNRGANKSSIGSVALTKETNAEGKRFMAVGHPSAGGHVDLYQIKTI